MQQAAAYPTQNNYPAKKLSKSKKRTSREWLTLVGGWACVCFTGVMIAIAFFSLFVEGFKLFPVFLVLSAFPALLAVACLVPKYRHITVRIVGGIICLACTYGYFFAADEVDPDNQVRRKGILIVIAIAMAGVAYTGRWPFGESEE